MQASFSRVILAVLLGAYAVMSLVFWWSDDRGIRGMTLSDVDACVAVFAAPRILLARPLPMLDLVLGIALSLGALLTTFMALVAGIVAFSTRYGLATACLFVAATAAHVGVAYVLIRFPSRAAKVI